MEEDAFTIVIHGGAGVIARWLPADAYKESLRRITAELYAYAKIHGKSPLDIVEHGVRLLENDSLFNAGKGAVFATDGTHELDASIMCGTTKTCGAISMFTRTKNPITAARTVMENTPHILMVGKKAEEMVAQITGVELVENSYFDTEKRRLQLEEAKLAGGQKVFRDHDLEKGKSPTKPNPKNSSDTKTDSSSVGDEKDLEGAKGTVGCVCVKGGRVAAATSTGGMTNKLNGRIGDSPIIGSGTYANNATCAVSATGHGEEFIRHVIAYDISARMEYGKQSLHDAAHASVHERLPAEAGGVIAVDAAGHCEMVFNCPGMFRGTCDSSGHAAIGIWDEMETIAIE